MRSHQKQNFYLFLDCCNNKFYLSTDREKIEFLMKDDKKERLQIKIK